jgi:hypothetical protein
MILFLSLMIFVYGLYLMAIAIFVIIIIASGAVWAIRRIISRRTPWSR